VKLSWNTCLKVGVSALLLYICIHFWPEAVGLVKDLFQAASPLWLGIVIAYVLNIPMSAFERRFFPNSEKKVVKVLRRPIGVLLAFVLVVGIITAVIWLIVPQLISCVQVVLKEIPGAFNYAVKWLDRRDWIPDDFIAQLQKVNLDFDKEQIVSVAVDGIEWIVELIKTLFSGVVTLVLGLIFAIYLLMAKDKLKRQYHLLIAKICKKEWIERIDYAASVLHDCFYRYTVGQCMEALILGVLCMIGMLILRLPYATMIGAVIAVTALVPVAGAYIGGAIGAFMILTVSPMKAVIFVVFLVILQQLENNLIYPKVMGTSIGLPSLWVLAAVTVGGGVMGVVGMLLGVPLTAAIYRMTRESVYKNEKPAPEEETEPPTIVQKPKVYKDIPKK